ncbi:unnamed protein product [Ilex paraguariensis]|uniref:ent-kaurene synthase n=1 Tax=Ilex paraguariensis TaxID=185542 RepID=A0ABC8RQQ1_9AQUA
MDVFQHFESGGEFFCFAGQSNQAVTGMYNLYRASQMVFPGEKILENAKTFSSKFLRDKRANNELLDKWIITKDLPGEVGYALDVPWCASLPRVETRFYLEHYGGDDDVWIGKTLYRMPYVNNNIYLELAKSDYNNCQALHHLEWNRMQKWYVESKLGQYGMSKTSLLYAYYLATANVFEPESANVRLAWAKTTALVASIMSYFDREHNSKEQRMAFVQYFRNSESTPGYANNGRYQTGHGLVQTLLSALQQFSLDALVAHGRDIHHRLHQAWEMWLLKWEEKGDVYQVEAELLVRTINLCAGRWISEELLSHPEYQCLSDTTNRVCHQLRQYQPNKDHGMDNSGSMATIQIESDMQKLVELVLCNSSDNGLNPDIKQTFLTLAKTFYYTTLCSPATINLHIAKILFERVL